MIVGGFIGAILGWIGGSASAEASARRYRHMHHQLPVEPAQDNREPAAKSMVVRSADIDSGSVVYRTGSNSAASDRAAIIRYRRRATTTTPTTTAQTTGARARTTCFAAAAATNRIHKYRQQRK